jgi:hypothetical protein
MRMTGRVRALMKMEKRRSEKRVERKASEGGQGAHGAAPREPVLDGAAAERDAGREAGLVDKGVRAKPGRPPSPFGRGQRVRKVKGYPFGDGEAKVVVTFWHRGKWKMIAEHPDGWLHIFDCEQMECS